MVQAMIINIMKRERFLELRRQGVITRVLNTLLIWHLSSKGPLYTDIVIRD